MAVEQKRGLIEAGSALSIREQCRLLGLERSSYYYEPILESPQTLQLMHRLDELFTAYPFYGTRRLTVSLQQEGYAVGRDRVRSLMQRMGLQAIYPKKNLSQRHPEHPIYPYLLSGTLLTRPGQVWSVDITYIRLLHGFMYLVAILDWYSRYVLSWRLSNSLEIDFCLEALQEALKQGKPDIFNSDQGSQFTSPRFTGILINAAVQISMDSQGRALDNIFVERFWRTLKYEDIYINKYENVPELQAGLIRYMEFYNYTRPHQSLGYRTPWQVHSQQQEKIS